MAAVLTLLVIACGLFYGPLLDFFQQEDAYQKEAAALGDLKAENRAMRDRIAEVGGSSWVRREARSQFQLVPDDVQAFVVTGLPSSEQTPEAAPSSRPRDLTLGQRLSDLWRALLR